MLCVYPNKCFYSVYNGVVAPMSNTALQVLIKMYKHSFTHECIPLSQVECFRPQGFGQELEGYFFCWIAKTWKTLLRWIQGWMTASGGWCFLSIHCSIQHVNNPSSGHRWMELLQTYGKNIFFSFFQNPFFLFLQSRPHTSVKCLSIPPHISFSSNEDFSEKALRKFGSPSLKLSVMCQNV